MHYHKYNNPVNFEYPKICNVEEPFKTRKGAYRMTILSSPDDIYYIRVEGKGWEKNDSHVSLRLHKPSRNLFGRNTKIGFKKDGTFILTDENGRILLSSQPGKFFGQSGPSSIFEFLCEPQDQFYGFGEKWTGLEHSGKKTKFWNADVWADFLPHTATHGNPDPVYVSIPYLILKRGNDYIGLLLNNPHATFACTGAKISISNQLEIGSEPRTFYLGAEQGQPNLFIIWGPSLKELTCKLQKIMGTTPLPPAWALGYHQCRWGYQSEKDLKELQRNFKKHEIPVDGLWLDIDYMDGFRLFTLSPKNFPHVEKTLDQLKRSGIKVVPILDPGVKVERGYDVYERGRKLKVFCQNAQGHEYIGYVWPGKTAFPDFSLKTARNWWTKEVAAFTKAGFDAYWLDMNDPATGHVENLDMLFDHGRKPHSSYHNQYASGMAEATRNALLDARPNERPFLLCRSGFIGINRYAAIWTGDNFSNYHHLKLGISTSLNLALSGIPFNAPDVGGFGGDTNRELIIAWHKAYFLFPFFRNHTALNTRSQEPWTFDDETTRILGHYIRLRYRFRHYLYQLFIRHEKEGEAILRPLFYDFHDTEKLPLGLIDDQFLIGPDVMQAPFLQENQVEREVILPGTEWYDLNENKWIDGNRKIIVRAEILVTPIYIREGAILPLSRNSLAKNVFESEQVDFHFFLKKDGETTINYSFDDGRTFDYIRGARSEVRITAKRDGDRLEIEQQTISSGHGMGDFVYTTLPEIREVTLNGRKLRSVESHCISITTQKMCTWKA